MPEMLRGAGTLPLPQIILSRSQSLLPFLSQWGELLGRALKFPFASPNVLLSGPLPQLSCCTPTERSFGAAQGRKERTQGVQQHKLFYPSQAITVRGDPGIPDPDARSFPSAYQKLAANAATSEASIR